MSPTHALVRQCIGRGALTLMMNVENRMLRPRNTPLPLQLPGESLAGYARRVGVHPNTVTRWRKQGRLVEAKSEDLALVQSLPIQDPLAGGLLAGAIQNRIVEAQAEYVVVRGKIEAALKSLAEVEGRVNRMEKQYRLLRDAEVVLGNEMAEREAAKRELDATLAALQQRRAVLAQSIREVNLQVVRKAMQDPEIKAQVLSEFAPTAPVPTVDRASTTPAPVDPVEVLTPRLGETRVLMFKYLLDNVAEYRDVYARFLSGQGVETQLIELGRRHAWSREELGFVSDLMREWKAAGVPGYVVDRRRVIMPTQGQGAVTGHF